MDRASYKIKSGNRASHRKPERENEHKTARRVTDELPSAHTTESSGRDGAVASAIGLRLNPGAAFRGGESRVVRDESCESFFLGISIGVA